MKKSYIAKLISQLVLTAAVLCASTFAVFAQNKDFPDFTTTPTGKGIMLMNRRGTPDFAFLISRGTEARLDAADGGVRIKTADGGEIAIYLTDAKLYAKTSGGEPEAIMKNYRAAIIPPVKVAPSEKIAVDTELNAMLPVFDLRGGKDEKAAVFASSWSLPISGGSNSARRVYLSFIIGDSILTLRKDMPNGDDTDEQNEAFMSTLKTLTLLPPQKIDAAPKKPPVKPRRKKT